LGVDRALFREGVALLVAMKRLYPGSFGWREEAAAASRWKAAQRRAEAAAVFMSPSKASRAVGLGGGDGDGEGRGGTGTTALRVAASSEDWKIGRRSTPGASDVISGMMSETALKKPQPSPPLPPVSLQLVRRRPPFIDLLTGSGRLREAMDASGEAGAGGRGRAGGGGGGRHETVKDVFESWEEELRAFMELRGGSLLYD
jgi:hypothetical protein